MNTAIATSVAASSHSALPARPTSSRAQCSKQAIQDAEVVEYMPLVYKIASQIHRHVNGNVDREDLVSWGTTGLLEAMSRFEPGHEARLATFAYYRIRGAMLDGIGKVAPLSRKCYRSARAAGDNHAIYRDPCEADLILDPRNAMSPEDFAERQQMQDILEEAIGNLSKEQQHLVRQHYFGGETLMDAGKDLGISKSWACRSHAKALRNLRSQMQRAVSLPS